MRRKIGGIGGRRVFLYSKDGIVYERRKLPKTILTNINLLKE